MKCKHNVSATDRSLAKASMRKAMKNCMDGLRKMQKDWKKVSEPLSQAAAYNNRFSRRRCDELPQNVLELVQGSSTMERNALVHSTLEWTSERRRALLFQLDDPYLQESLRAEFVRRSPMWAWACIHWHLRTQHHRNPPSHKTTGIVAGT